MNVSDATPLRVGWAQTDITPDRPVLIAGQFYARVSEGVDDPLTVTALVLENEQDYAVMVSCDIATINDRLRDGVREQIGQKIAKIDPQKIVLNATHTHSALNVRLMAEDTGGAGDGDVTLPSYGDVVLPDHMPVSECLAMVVDRIVRVIEQAWQARQPGKVAFGLGQAVIGRNRRIVLNSGESVMYGRHDDENFSHIEGYEDHTLGVLACYDMQGRLTGLLVNVPCPSQVSESEFTISADYWYETRIALRERFGRDIFILPQCSAAGDLSPRQDMDGEAFKRMLKLAGRTLRDEIAHRITNAVGEVLPIIEPHAVSQLILKHDVQTVQLPMNLLSEDDVRHALHEAEKCYQEYCKQKQAIDTNPDIQKTPRWYTQVTRAYRRMGWYRAVEKRYERQQADTRWPAEVHVIRLGDAVFATNPFEYYLDFGIKIKARSAAAQTFLVQLAGSGKYVPSLRSTQGGGYGSVPASNPIGPEGGQQLAEHTITTIKKLMRDQGSANA